MCLRPTIIIVINEIGDYNIININIVVFNS